MGTYHSAERARRYKPKRSPYWDGLRIEGTSCPTPGKISYDSRKAARSWKRRNPALTHDSLIKAYRCPCGQWHLGHIRADVVAGHRTRAVYT